MDKGESEDDIDLQGPSIAAHARKRGNGLPGGGGGG